MSPIIFTASSYVPASTMAPFTSCQAALFTGRCLEWGGTTPNNLLQGLQAHSTLQSCFRAVLPPAARPGSAKRWFRRAWLSRRLAPRHRATRAPT